MEARESPLAMVEFRAEYGYLRFMPSESRTGWVYSPRFLEHNAGLAHPECPERLAAIVERLKDDGVLARLRHLKISEATDDELARAHTRRHIAELAQCGGRQLDPDTYCGFETPEIARLAAGGVLEAARAVMKGEIANAFCAVRPPGHHATADRAMGFCYLNSVAVAAANIVAEYPESRIAILDWDVHHGNGTQAIFHESDRVLYGSVHQFPFYPGTGSVSEIGRGAGKGFTINKPLLAGAGDQEFLDSIGAILGEAASMTPDLLMISAGFDAHVDDSLANLEVSAHGFAEATGRACAFAERFCNGRLVSVLEGGYNPRALADSVAAHITVLIEATHPD